MDFSVSDQGTIIIVTPITENCVEWCDKHVDAPDYMLVGDHGFACDHRMAQPIIEALVDEGFEPEV